MDKTAFLSLLRAGLAGLPQEDIDERVNFYSEMIDDYVEEGLSEEEATSRIGSANEIAAQIIADTSPSAAEEGKTKHRRRLGVTAIVLIILGSPIWLSLLISAFAVVFSLYVSLWAVIVSFWSVFGALCSCSFACILGGAAMSVTGFSIQGIAMIGAGLVCGGLSVFTFYGCKAATKGTVLLSKKFILGIVRKLSKKEDA